MMRFESLGSTAFDACLVSIWVPGGQPLSRSREGSSFALYTLRPVATDNNSSESPLKRSQVISTDADTDALAHADTAAEWGSHRRLRLPFSGSMTAAIPRRRGCTTDCWPCCFLLLCPRLRISSISPACGSIAHSSASRRDSLRASTAPVSRGQIGRSAAYVLAERDSVPQHGRYGEPNIRDFNTSARRKRTKHHPYGSIFGRVLTLGPCRTWQSCTQSHRHRWASGR